MAASYPSATKTFTTKADGGTINAAHINDLQLEVTAIEGGLRAGLAHDLLFTDATYDIGKSGLTRPRDFFLSRNAVVGGTLAVTGVVTFTAVPVFSAGLPTLAQHLLFTDATYDIGASGATRPRDFFLSRNATVGGTLLVTGIATFTALPVFTTALTTLGTITTGVWNAGAITSSGAITAALDMAVAAGKKIYLDGVAMTGDTYIAETSANTMEFITGGGTHMSLNTEGALTLPHLASGNLTSASGVITSSSDERMKDIVGPLDYGLSEVLQLRPVRYHWKATSGISPGPEYGGFGAAQVESSMPLAVSYGDNGMRSLHDRVILGAVVNAVQVLDARMRVLETP